MVVHLRMHRSGLSYIQTDLDPDDVKSLVLLATKEGKVTDIVPIYKTRITPMHVSPLRMYRGRSRKAKTYR